MLRPELNSVVVAAHCEDRETDPRMAARASTKSSSSDRFWSAGIRDAFGLIGTTFRELDWRMRIFFERAVPISPNAR